MKKVYEKPLVTYESFELSTSITASCLYEQSAVDIACPITLEFGVLFASKEYCTVLGPGRFDQVCYHVPIAYSDLYQS